MQLTEFVRAVLFIFFSIGVQGKPSMTVTWPTLGSFLNFGPKFEKRVPVKSYSGDRISEDSIRMVYVHDQTVAIVELGPNKLLLNCEIIEIYGPEDVDTALGELKDSAKPLQIMFEDMLKLMRQCVQLENQGAKSVHEELMKNFNGRLDEARHIINSQISLFSGIIPGTKWCGTGDIAKDYHDLGEDIGLDKCCRTHDLCPTKIRAYSNNYNLTNMSLYTKSDCQCDDMLWSCMKTQSSRSAQILGNIYFNLVRVPCLDGTQEHKHFRHAKQF